MLPRNRCMRWIGDHLAKLVTKMEIQHFFRSRVVNNQLDYARDRQGAPPDLHDLKPRFRKNLTKFVFRPFPCRSHHPHLHVNGRLKAGGTRTWHHDIVDEKLTVTGCHRIPDMTEDSERVVVVPVMQDAVQIVSASTSDRLRLEKVVWNPSNLAVTC